MVHKSLVWQAAPTLPTSKSLIPFLGPSHLCKAYYISARVPRRGCAAMHLSKEWAKCLAEINSISVWDEIMVSRATVLYSFTVYL
jgi:hypothetical protein